MAVAARIALVGVVAVLLFVWHHPKAVVDRMLAFQHSRNELREVDLSDGIQQQEADLIAAGYEELLDRWSACSGTTTPALINGEWRAEVLVGFGGERTGEWIVVDPISGDVSWLGGRTHQTFASFRRAVLLRAILDGR
jgi:hypothetical protein